jgi:chaperonin GroES
MDGRILRIRRALHTLDRVNAQSQRRDEALKAELADVEYASVGEFAFFELDGGNVTLTCPTRDEDRPVMHQELAGRLKASWRRLPQRWALRERLMRGARAGFEAEFDRWMATDEPDPESAEREACAKEADHLTEVYAFNPAIAGVCAALAWNIRNRIRLQEEQQMEIRPMNDNVLIRRAEVQDVTPGGIIIPEAAKRKSTRAEVVAVGPGKVDKNGLRFIETTVKPGDIVLLSEWSGQEVVVDGETLLFVGEPEILAVIEP